MRVYLTLLALWAGASATSAHAERELMTREQAKTSRLERKLIKNKKKRDKADTKVEKLEDQLGLDHSGWAQCDEGTQRNAENDGCELAPGYGIEARREPSEPRPSPATLLDHRTPCPPPSLSLRLAPASTSAPCARRKTHAPASSASIHLFGLRLIWETITI